MRVRFKTTRIGRRPNRRGVVRRAVLAALALSAAVAAASAARATGAAANARSWGSARGENAPSGPGMSPPQRFTVQVNGHPLAVWARIPLTARGAVLLVHGRTWSGRPDFDLDVPG